MFYQRLIPRFRSGILPFQAHVSCVVTRTPRLAFLAIMFALFAVCVLADIPCCTIEFSSVPVLGTSPFGELPPPTDSGSETKGSDVYILTALANYLVNAEGTFRDVARHWHK